ncbi:hypothetical protein HK100_004740 [Physocladia obscura]|uniref:Uncharacterized protein n=1 Tax=Physocladia obscura TaxID=109957 RepID=A0AAD5STI2_9FUNG|nr:hypothetical protein HK100_004740 [Physocladia obscura]
MSQPRQHFAQQGTTRGTSHNGQSSSSSGRTQIISHSSSNRDDVMPFSQQQARAYNDHNPADINFSDSVDEAIEIPEADRRNTDFRFHRERSSRSDLIELKDTIQAGGEEEHGGEEDDEDYLDEIYQIIDAIVPRSDDSSLPALTFRVWFIGLVFGSLLCAANTVFTFRTNQIVLPAFLVVLLAYPIGILMATALPKGILNPAPFNFKEHALIYVIVNAMSTTPYALSNIIVQKYQLYQDGLTIFACIVFAVVTQCFGYGFAGLSRRFLVRPPSMLWPANFAIISMLNSLHINDDISGGRYPMSRFKFFWLALSAMFFFTFIPQYAAPMTGALSVICWFINNKPLSSTKKILLALGSSSPGAGMGFLSFSLDWSLYNTFNPITTPLWAIFNQFLGLYLMLWVVVPICWSINVYDGDQLVGQTSPYGFALNTPFIYDKNGSQITTSQFIYRSNTSDGTSQLLLNETFYNSVQPLYITTYFATTYISSFVAFASAVVHVIIWYGGDIWQRFRMAMKDLDSTDIHAQLMNVYPEVPDWWYYLILLITAAAGMVVCQVGGFELPWWGVIIAIIFALVSMIPIGIIQAISGQQIGLNVMSEFIIGLILPGQIASVMAFKTFSYMAMAQGLQFVQDLKLGHYIKIAPKAMFISQLVSTVLGAVISTVLACNLYESFGKAPETDFEIYPLGFSWNFQTQDSESGWNAGSYETFLSAGVIWGAVGPARFFGPQSPYRKTLLGFAFGIILPFIPWVMYKIQPEALWHLINIPIIIAIPIQPYSQQSIFITPLLVAIIVNFYIKKYRSTWWKKYAYIMSSAFDSGSSIAVLLIFFVTKFNPSNLLAFPAWLMNPYDFERCLPDSFLDCQSHETMGNAYGGEFNASLDSSFCQSVLDGSYLPS